MLACKIIVGQDGVRETENVPLSNSTINRCIDDMLHDTEGFCATNCKITISLSRLMSQ
jgi:hypothetical protein